MKLDQAVIESLRDLGGDDLVQQLFRTFLDHLPTRLGDLRGAAERKDREELGRAVHSLRSSSAILGAPELSELAGKLEALADEDECEALFARVPELERKVLELAALFEAELAKPGGEPAG